MLREPGETFTDGLERLRLTGDREAVLDRVQFVTRPGHQRSIEHLGTLVAGSQRKVGAIQVNEGFPPDEPRFGEVIPVEGATLTPGGLGSLLLIGIKRVGDEYAVREGINVYYTVGEERFVTYFPATIVFCPSSITDEQCSERWEAEGGHDYQG